MKIDSTHSSFESIKNADWEVMHDGTFCIVSQNMMIELYYMSTVLGDFWDVTTSKVPANAEGIFNSWETKGEAFGKLFSEQIERVFFDNAHEAHEHFCAFIMKNQITQG